MHSPSGFGGSPSPASHDSRSPCLSGSFRVLVAPQRAFLGFLGSWPGLVLLSSCHSLRSLGKRLGSLISSLRVSHTPGGKCLPPPLSLLSPQSFLLLSSIHLPFSARDFLPLSPLRPSPILNIRAGLTQPTWLCVSILAAI